MNHTKPLNARKLQSRYAHIVVESKPATLSAVVNGAPGPALPPLIGKGSECLSHDDAAGTTRTSAGDQAFARLCRRAKRKHIINCALLFARDTLRIAA